MKTGKIALILTALVFFGACSNTLLENLEELYSGISADDLKPSEINGQNYATADLTLIDSFDGKSIEWNTASHTGIGTAGGLSRPVYSGSDISGTITGTVIFKSGRRKSFTYNVIVAPST